MPVPPPRQPLLALCCAALLAAAAAAAGAPSGEAARLAEVNALKDTIHRLPAKEAARRFAALTARGAPPPRQDAIDHFVVLCKPTPAGHLAPACSLAAAAAWLLAGSGSSSDRAPRRAPCRPDMENQAFTRFFGCMDLPGADGISKDGMVSEHNPPPPLWYCVDH
jgi:hypothetical protein